MIEVRVNDRDLKRLERQVKALGGRMSTVMVRALNRTAATGRTRLARLLAAQVGSTVKTARESLEIHKARGSRWVSRLDMTWSSLRGDPVILHLKGARSRDTSTGTKYDLSRVRAGFLRYKSPITRKTVVLRHAFVAVMPSGHTGVFERRGRARLPIDEQRTETIWDVSQSRGGYRTLFDRVARESDDILAKSINDQVRLILKRRAG